jgi:predicted permease
MMLVGRLRPGLSIEAANAALEPFSRQLEAAYPAEQQDQRLVVHRLPRMSISSAPRDDFAEMLTVSALLQGMAGSVLLIACLNLANMLLARGAARRKEIAIRLAIGGGRWQIVRQLLVEGFVLSAAGGLAGLVIAYWSGRLLSASLTAALPFSLDLAIMPDARVLIVTFGLTVACTLVFALGPAWSLSRHDVVADLREQSSAPAARARLGLLAPRHLLVIAQVALSLVLLAMGGLFVRSALEAADATPGYDLNRGLLLSLDPGLAGTDEAGGRELYRAALERVRALPGVAEASIASLVAFGEMTETRTVSATSPTSGRGTRGGPEVDAHRYIVGGRYFSTLGVSLLRGRDFSVTEEQSPGGPAVAIVDEPLARRLWPGQDPVGQRLFVKADREGDPALVLDVIGLVAGTRHDLFDREPVPHVFVPFGANYRSSMHLHVRSRAEASGGEAGLLALVREELRALDGSLPILATTTLSAHRDGTIMMWVVRTGGRLFLLFGLLALTLAVVGLYGVKAYLVARRTREIAIRMALGASDRAVLWMVLRDGLAVTAVGLLAGAGLALAASQAVASLLYNVSPIDPLTFALVTIFMLATAAMAAYLPARRAARTTPVVALREG